MKLIFLTKIHFSFSLVNPLMTYYMHSASLIFVDTFPSCSFLRDETWLSTHSWRTLSGNTITDIHDSPELKLLWIKVEICPLFICRALLILDQIGSSNTRPAVRMFLED